MTRYLLAGCVAVASLGCWSSSDSTQTNEAVEPVLGKQRAGLDLSVTLDTHINSLDNTPKDSSTFVWGDGAAATRVNPLLQFNFTGQSGTVSDVKLDLYVTNTGVQLPNL
jgi:hypothetical protein